MPDFNIFGHNSHSHRTENDEVTDPAPNFFIYACKASLIKGWTSFLKTTCVFQHFVKSGHITNMPQYYVKNQKLYLFLHFHFMYFGA